jgi:hypothetical protein
MEKTVDPGTYSYIKLKKDKLFKKKSERKPS